jgi:hypothetical protein
VLIIDIAAGYHDIIIAKEIKDGPGIMPGPVSKSAKKNR